MSNNNKIINLWYCKECFYVRIWFGQITEKDKLGIKLPCKICNRDTIQKPYYGVC
jgi:hypothetical protein